eukprot:CAMPEP_0204621842 /NCGR_PEP_ID=MMETSP0717-20131115/7495_1 /ASSEMBLY_ACC=CAM_ASM_000666 /TAXON_ID=230516 /ORGANISM="Chaetoceros curvisetus" /LENGTH=160 /DNA_ID=CAMNT_0051636363 /DNA_START=115 /DNA_END=597 /DNA_ORIENTATION=+
MTYFTTQRNYSDQDDEDYFIGDNGKKARQIEKAQSFWHVPSSSEPIKCPQSDDLSLSNSSELYEQDLHHYNSLTWNMYRRIVNSRKSRGKRHQRPDSRSSFSSGRWLHTSRLRKKNPKATLKYNNDASSTASETSYDGMSDHNEFEDSPYPGEGMFHLEM